VLHRDLKPSNVMLGKYGETLVVDWGLAKTIGRTETHADTGETTLHPTSGSGSAPTLVGTALGTPQYMSPEQASGRLDELGPRSDVYSLGATLYCLLTGQAPFRDNDVGAVLQRVQEGRFLPPRQLNKQVPRALEAICLKAMSLKPENRYSSPRVLADELERWLAEEPVQAHRETATETLGRWARRNRAWATAAAIMLIVLTAASCAVTLMANEQRKSARKVAELLEAERGSLLEKMIRARKQWLQTIENALSAQLIDEARSQCSEFLALFKGDGDGEKLLEKIDNELAARLVEQSASLLMRGEFELAIQPLALLPPNVTRSGNGIIETQKQKIRDEWRKKIDLLFEQGEIKGASKLYMQFVARFPKGGQHDRLRTLLREASLIIEAPDARTEDKQLARDAIANWLNSRTPEKSVPDELRGLQEVLLKSGVRKIGIFYLPPGGEQYRYWKDVKRGATRNPLGGDEQYSKFNLVEGPTKLQYVQWADEYNDAIRKLASGGTIQQWSSFADLCTALQKKLVEYRNRPGIGVETDPDRSFKDWEYNTQAEVARELLADWDLFQKVMGASK
jgi:hypothetical protein